MIDPGKFRTHTGITPYEFVEYIIKCVTGVSAIFPLFMLFPDWHDDIYWMIISLMISMTYNNESKAAIERMRGNVIGSIVGGGCWFLKAFLTKYGTIAVNQNAALLLCIIIGLVVIITACAGLKMISVARTALVGFFIVIIYEDHHHSWQGAIIRLASVVTGCMAGLCINKSFAWASRVLFGEKIKGSEKEADEDSIY